MLVHVHLKMIAWLPTAYARAASVSATSSRSRMEVGSLAPRSFLTIFSISDDDWDTRR